MAVRHPFNDVAAIPEEATATAMLDLARTVAKTTDMRNVLPVPQSGNINHHFHHQLPLLVYHKLPFVGDSTGLHSFELFNLIPGDNIHVPVSILD